MKSVNRVFCILLFLFLQASPLLPMAAAQSSKPALDAETLSGVKFRAIGPGLMSGRIADIAIHPSDQSTWYVAAGSGGLWKTTNAGTTWTPIFDSQASYSLGCVAIDPGNPKVVWVGSGENVSGRHVGFGDGVYKSLDGGHSWKNKGLGESEHISKILIDPRDSNVVYVAAEGPLWNSGGERGVFKSLDGGETWKPVLSISENTGVADLEFDPRNPDVLFAAAYQRRRHIWALLAGGPESGIYKSKDGGGNWKRLEKGLPGGDMGKIGLAVSPINPDIVYATIEANEKERGFYRSEDGGESWEKQSSYLSDGTGPHYYQEIYASPHRLDRIYQMDVWIHVSDDGGKTFRRLGEPDKHSDNHALAFDPRDPDYLLAGSDGGLYESFDLGKSWKYVSNLPVTQIYKMAVDNDFPFYHIVGGTQDNGTIYGPSRTASRHGIQNRDWWVPYGADGYVCKVDPEDPDILYVSWQGGNLLRYDRRSRELVDIKPQPQPGDPPERWNWDSPLLISPHSSSRLYFGSQRLWRSDDRGQSWKAVSADLSRNLNRYELKMMGRVWSVDALYDNGAMSVYGNITAISESPLREGLLYVGTDDGVIQVSEDEGRSWRRLDSIPGVPDRSFVNDIQASLHNPGTVYALFDNHKVGDFKPYLMKSTDRGRSWSSIVGDLPQRNLVWSIAEDHQKPGLLFLGTEYGIYFTLNGGDRWIQLKGSVPTIAFRDIEIQRRENDLVAASFGRGFFVLDDYSYLRELTEETFKKPSQLFPIRSALRYIPSVDLGVGGKGYQGGSSFTAPNPDFGALITYFLRDSLQSERQLRQEREKELQKEGSDNPFPGWDRLKEEARQKEPSLLVVIQDANGNVIRRLNAPSSAGLHRVSWDLRYPPSDPIEVKDSGPLPPWASPPAGPLAAPGRYGAQLFILKGGELEELSGAQFFEVVELPNQSLQPAGGSEVFTFHRQAFELERRVLGAAQLLRSQLEKMPYIRKALLETPAADRQLLQRAEEIERHLLDLREQLIEDSIRPRWNEASVPSVLQRVTRVAGALGVTRYGPTETQKMSLAAASQQFEVVKTELGTLQREIEHLEQEMEAAGAPWTPGRSIP